MNDPNDAVARLLRFRRALEQLIEDVLPGPGDSIAGAGPTVALDVFVRPAEVEVLVEVPGVRADHIEISTSGAHVIIDGHRPPEPCAIGSILMMERPVGRFRRVVEMPVPVDTGRARGVLRDGVLAIHLPRISDRRGLAHRIPVDADPQSEPPR